MALLETLDTVVNKPVKLASPNAGSAALPVYVKGLNVTKAVLFKAIEIENMADWPSQSSIPTATLELSLRRLTTPDPAPTSEAIEAEDGFGI